MPKNRSILSRKRERPALALHWRIAIGLLAGLLLGIALNLAWSPAYWSQLGVADAASFLAGKATAANADASFLSHLIRFAIRLNGFVGAVFIRCLRSISAPIVLFSLIVGASSLNDIKKLSRIGGKTIAIYMATTALSISIGLIFANAFRPGELVDATMRDQLAVAGAAEATTKIAAAKPPDTWNTILEIIPLNPFEALASGSMLQIVFFSLAIGMALTLIPEEKAKPVVVICDALTEAVIKVVNVMMWFAPIAVFSLIVQVVAQLGIDVLGVLWRYFQTVMLGLLTMTFVVYPVLLRLFSPMRFRRFFRAIAPAQLLAFSSSSSSATLPVTLKCAEDGLGVHEEVASFALPLGSTVNMDGTALYQGVATVFIAQIYGISLSLESQLTIVMTATLASVGTAGVPGVGLIMLVIVLQSVGMGPEVMAGGIAIIFAVDRILDMSRTVVNVTGDLAVSVIVAQSEGGLLSEEQWRARQKELESTPLDQHPKVEADDASSSLT
jgi:Na+/H+-dicarboxylate symporter